eukprot:6600515-Prymnesium_polylepis.1
MSHAKLKEDYMMARARESILWPAKNCAVPLRHLVPEQLAVHEATFNPPKPEHEQYEPIILSPPASECADDLSALKARR